MGGAVGDDRGSGRWVGQWGMGGAAGNGRDSGGWEGQ